MSMRWLKSLIQDQFFVWIISTLLNLRIDLDLLAIISEFYCSVFFGIVVGQVVMTPISVTQLAIYHYVASITFQFTLK